MIEKIITRWEIWKLNRHDRRTAKAYDKDRALARSTNKETSALRRIDEDEHFERRLYQDEISKIQSRSLCRTAGRLGVPVPYGADEWEESTVVGGRYLTTKGFSDLRSAVRREKNERWAYWELRMKVAVRLITALTGVIGALIGLAAILGIRISD